MPTELINDGLFTVSEGRATLIGGYSPTSGHHHFPLSDTCPYSGATDVERRDLSSHGVVWAVTTVMIAPPGYVGDTPYGFGVVELPEGLRVVTRLLDEVAIGDQVACVTQVVDTPDGPRVTWAFGQEDGA